MAHPVSPRLRIHIGKAASTWFAMPPMCARPQFSTLAESLMYKNLGYSVIGMTNMREAKLAREAEICYATVAIVTDFDCWHLDHDAVTVQDTNSAGSKTLCMVRQKRRVVCCIYDRRILRSVRLRMAWKIPRKEFLHDNGFVREVMSTDA
jgi:purine nucleoside phosphorylase